MKLLRLKLKTGFRGLQKDFEIDFSKQVKDHSRNPICFVGPNGSGKSNVLEVIAEIFYYLDSFIFNFEEDTLFDKKPFGFEIEYLLKNVFHKEEIHIRIEKDPDQFPFLYEISKDGIWNEIFLKSEDNDFIKYLPTRIIGYSSGLNELVSNPFLKIKFYYYDSLIKHQKNKNINTSNLGDTRLFLLDYDSNAIILLSNFLLQDSKILQIFKDIIKIQGIYSFRINLKLPGDLLDIQFKELFNRQIENLKNCATSFSEEIIERKEKIN
jgi:hypothetical protein